MNSVIKTARLNVGLVLLALSLAGSTRSLNAATVYTLDASGDNAILAGTASTNYGSIDQIQTGNSASQDTRSVIRFDTSSLTGVLDGTNEVTNITMRLYLKNFEDTELKTSEVYAISASNASWLESSSNWTNRSTGPSVPWVGGSGLATAGVSYDSFLFSSQSFTSATAPANNTAIDFVFSGTEAQKTALIQSWADVVNSGLLLLDPNGQTLPGSPNRIIYHSREASTVGFRPQLFVTVEDLPPVPEPGSLLLMVGGLAMISAKVRRKRGVKRT